MIRAAVGLSQEPNTARAALDAARQVLRQLDGAQPDWCIVFASDEHTKYAGSLQQALSSALGTPYVVGCSAAGVLGADREIDEGPGLGVLAVASDQLTATPFLFQDAGDRGLTAATRLGQRMLGSKDSGDLLLVWPDPFHVRPDLLLTGIDALLPGIPVVGGASSSRHNGPTLQFCGTEAASSAVSGVRIGGRFRHSVVVTQGCAPLGPPLKATQVHENLILELDGRPALDVIREQAPEGSLDDPAVAALTLFVGLVPSNAADTDYLVRNIVSIDPDTGVVALADRLAEGQRLVLAARQPEAARRDLERVLERVRSENDGSAYRFGLYFNCRARGRALYREPDVDATLLGRYLPGVPLLGFFCDAEMAPLGGQNRLFTYSGVLLLVSE